MMEWITGNAEAIVLGWAMIVAILKFVAMVVPGTKDDEIIVKITDTGAKILSLGATNLLGEGRQKS